MTRTAFRWNQTADQLARTKYEHLFTGPEPACSISIGVAKKAVKDWMNRNHKKHWESVTGLKTGKGTYISTLCWKNEGSVEIKHRPVKMGGRLFTGHCYLKGHLSKLGLTDDPTCKWCLEKDESATHILRDCEAIAYLTFRHLGKFFMEPSDYYDAPIHKVLHFIESVRLIKG
jgi:hypothetical protein